MREKLICKRTITVSHFNELQTWSEIIPLCFTVGIQTKLRLPTATPFVHWGGEGGA